MISKQIGWSTESNLLWEILRQLSRLGGVLSNLVKNTTPKYKVFSALVTQSGGSVPSDLSGGDLTIGVSYEIVDNGGSGWDFTNVGAPNNDIGTFFVATEATPNSWGIDGQLNYNEGTPIVNVLENTVGNIWFTYENPGFYSINSINLFEGTVPTVTSVFGLFEMSTTDFVITAKDTSNRIILQSLNPAFANSDDLLNNTFIEFRIYS